MMMRNIPNKTEAQSSCSLDLCIPGIPVYQLSHLGYVSLSELQVHAKDAD